MRTVAIVGGGFTGACVAVQLVRAARQALHVTIVEPDRQLGRGLAYSTLDPDHRLNGPSFGHSIVPEDAWHLVRWCEERSILTGDPDARAATGVVYLRRSDYAKYLADSVALHADWPTGSKIEHVCDRATAATPSAGGWQVHCASGQAIVADMLIIATGNPKPRLPRLFAAECAAHPAVIEHAFDAQRLHAIAPDARVLLVGGGLTALDVLSTLVRRGHRGELLAVSRHGLRPAEQGPLPASSLAVVAPDAPAKAPERFMLDRLLAPAPAFMTPPHIEPTLRSHLCALRARMRQVEQEGGNWRQAFDDLRDSVWRVWPALPVQERRRFFRKLHTWYDAHRFRSPPQNEAIVRAAEAQGRVRFLAAHVLNVAPAEPSLAATLRARGATQSRRETFDVVINCAGLDRTAALSANPLLTSLAEQGVIRPDACAMGWDVDARCRAIDRAGAAHSNLRMFGPPTFGTFGDPLGAMFIAAQIYRALPDMLADID